MRNLLWSFVARCGEHKKQSLVALKLACRELPPTPTLRCWAFCYGQIPLNQFQNFEGGRARKLWELEVCVCLLLLTRWCHGSPLQPTVHSNSSIGIWFINAINKACYSTVETAGGQTSEAKKPAFWIFSTSSYHRLVRVENHNTELFITNHLATVKKGLLVYYFPTGSCTARLDDIFILAPKPSIEYI